MKLKNILSYSMVYQFFSRGIKNILATYLVAKLDGIVVGYIGAWFVLDECHITNIAVHKNYRNSGIASKLVKELLRLCYEHATTYITLGSACI